MSTKSTATTSTTSSAASESNPTIHPRRSNYHKKHRSKSSTHNTSSGNGLDYCGSVETTTPSILHFWNKDELQEKQHKDPLHNLSTPCCALIRAAALDILPENHHVVGGTAVPQSSSSTSSTLPTTLLGRIVKQFLLDQHKSRRQHAAATTKYNPNGVRNDSDIAPNNEASAKRKRKKKKKKPKATTSNTATNTTASASGDDDDDDDLSLREGEDYGAVLLETHNAIGANGIASEQVVVVQTEMAAAMTDLGSTCQQHPTADWTTATPWATDDKHVLIPTAATVPPANVTTNAGDAFVEQCLDAILDSPLPSSDLPSNRTLESFLTFLCKRLSDQSTTNLETRNGAGDSHNGTTSAAKRKKSTSSLANTRSLDHSRLMLFALPVDRLLAMCESICCPRCRQSAQTYLTSALQQHRRERRTKAMGNESTSSTPITPCFILNAAAVEAPVEIVRQSNLAIPVTSHSLNNYQNDDDDDWDVERAFDYVALEEGTNFFQEEVERNVGLEEFAASPDMLALHVEQQESSEHEVLVFTNAVATLGNRHTVGAFLRSIVLACGLEAHDVYSSGGAAKIENFFPLDKNQFQRICDRVQDSERKMLSQLDDIGVQLGCAQSQWDDISHSARSSKDDQETNLEFQSAPNLRKCDAECLEITSSILRFLRCLTREYNAVLVKTEEIRSLQPVMELLWEGFFEAAKGMMDAMDEYHEQLAVLSNRDVVPQMFVSAAHRRIYRKLLESKLHCLSACYSRLQGINEGDDNTEKCTRQNSPSLLRFVYTSNFFCDIIGEVHTGAVQDKQAELDELWGDATHQLISCTSTIFRGYLSDMKDEHKVRREKLDTLQLCFFQAINAQYNHTTEKHRPAKRAMQRWQELVNQYMTLQKQRRDESSNGFANSQVFFQRITRVMFQLWCHINVINCDVQRSDNEHHPSMPLELMEWMSYGRLDSTAPMRKKDEACSGGGGKRRITSILAGFIYRWLVNRCEEWNSELAEAELLTSVEIASLSDGNEQLSSRRTIKTGKKNRRKREKRGDATESVGTKSPPLDIVEESSSDDNNRGNTSAKDRAVYQANGVSNKIEASQQNDAFTKLVSGKLSINDERFDLNKDESKTGGKEVSNEAKAQSQTSLYNGDNESSHDAFFSNDEDYVQSEQKPESFAYVSCEEYVDRSSVVIVDAFGRESAEDFLVGRLLKLLNGQDPFICL